MKNNINAEISEIKRRIRKIKSLERQINALVARTVNLDQSITRRRKVWDKALRNK